MNAAEPCAAAACLEVSNVSFSYGRQPILHNMSFTTAPGELIALIGPNGVGKSTLFRCILGFLKSYTGAITVAGRNTRTLPARELARYIAYIPQSSAQVFDFTVMELVLMGMAAQLPLLSTPGHAEEDEARRVLAELGVEHLEHRGCGQISGGEYQLVLLARAILQKAHILLMDEPTANLDYGNQYRVMERIAALANRNFTIIFSTHDPNQVLTHTNRTIVVQRGVLCADGPPQQVMSEELLSSIYNIEVRRFQIQDSERSYPVCVPVGLQEQGRQ